MVCLIIEKHDLNNLKHYLCNLYFNKKAILSALKKLAGETVIYGASSIVGRFLNYFLTPLYAWTFLPAEFGILSNILAYVAFFQVV